MLIASKSALVLCCLVTLLGPRPDRMHSGSSIWHLSGAVSCQAEVQRLSGVHSSGLTGDVDVLQVQHQSLLEESLVRA